MRVNYIELLGEKHPLCFSLAASEELSEQFGDLNKMSGELTSKDAKRVAQAVDKVLNALLKAGRIYASAMGHELPKPIPCRPADLLDVRDSNSMKVIMEAMTADTKREVQTEGNAGATQDR